jgi:hypothetical protein
MASYTDIETRVKKWISDLDLYNEGPLWKVHEEGEWSIGQMCYFLTDFGSAVVTVAITDCLADPERKSKKTLKGKMTLVTGKPKGLKQIQLKPTSNKLSIFELKDRLIKLLKDFAAFDYPLKNKGAFNHAVYGDLSAKDWFDILLVFFDHFEKHKQKVNKHLM